MIFVDATVPMYLVGDDHPRRSDSVRLLERFAVERRRLVTDAEVFGEILRGYAAIDRREAIQPVFDVLSAVVDDVLPIERADIMRAKDLLATHAGLAPGCAVHAAVVLRHEITKLFSFDACFDVVAGIERIPRAAAEP